MDPIPENFEDATNLTSEPIEVEDPRGRGTVRARLTKCPCGGKTFLLITVRPDNQGHLHRFCTTCGTTYCAVGCARRQRDSGLSRGRGVS